MQFTKKKLPKSSSRSPVDYYLETALYDGKLLELWQTAQSLDPRHHLPDDAQHLQVREVLQADHAREPGEEHLKGEAGQAFLAQSAVHEPVAGALFQKTQQSNQIKSNHTLMHF